MPGFDFDYADIVRKIIVFLPPALFAITLHEVAHGWAAKKLGDPTASMAGRLTLNPIKHVDPLGTIVVPLALYFLVGWAFGWAKPVPVVFENLKHPKRDLILVAAAGPVSNLIMATFWAVWITAVILTGMSGEPGEIGWLLQHMGIWGIYVNVILAVFNMLPIPPLDGGRVLAGLLPQRFSAILDRIEPFGILIILLLMATNILYPVILPYIDDLRTFFETLALVLAGID
jgi:Zn-dependent protease